VLNLILVSKMNKMVGPETYPAWGKAFGIQDQETERWIPVFRGGNDRGADVFVLCAIFIWLKNEPVWYNAAKIMGGREHENVCCTRMRE
jgi:hypothetical protein